ncbi:MAG: MFS transporter [Pseudolabrys sp.]
MPRRHEIPVKEAVEAPDSITYPLILLFATAVGAIIMNLFAAQTQVGLVASSLHMSRADSGLVAMAPLLGYAAGLFFLVPLADLMENRRLVVAMIGGAALMAAGVALAKRADMVLVLLFALGAASSAIQVLVPIAASMAAEHRRGRVIGDVMSGLMIGILLARPFASGIASAFGWRAFYVASAALMTVLALVLGFRLSVRRPVQRQSYGRLIVSLWHLLRDEPVLRRRSLLAALVMAAFSLFWTAIALRLAQPPFDYTQRGIAIFALVGVGGAIATPLSGRWGDRGWTRKATVGAHLATIGAFLLIVWAGAAAQTTQYLALVGFGLGAVILDMGVTSDQTLGRRLINLLQPEARGRINGLFVGIFFLGGAVGSATAGFAWASGGWPLVCLTGIGFAVLCLLVDVTMGAG